METKKKLFAVLALFSLLFVQIYSSPGNGNKTLRDAEEKKQEKEKMYEEVQSPASRAQNPDLQLLQIGVITCPHCRTNIPLCLPESACRIQGVPVPSAPALGILSTSSASYLLPGQVRATAPPPPPPPPMPLIFTDSPAIRLKTRGTPGLRERENNGTSDPESAQRNKGPAAPIISQDMLQRILQSLKKREDVQETHKADKSKGQNKNKAGPSTPIGRQATRSPLESAPAPRTKKDLAAFLAESIHAEDFEERLKKEYAYTLLEKDRTILQRIAELSRRSPDITLLQPSKDEARIDTLTENLMENIWARVKASGASHTLGRSDSSSPSSPLSSLSSNSSSGEDVLPGSLLQPEILWKPAHASGESPTNAAAPPKPNPKRSPGPSISPANREENEEDDRSSTSDSEWA